MYYKHKHSLVIKVIACVVTAAFLVNDIAFCLDYKSDSARSALAPTLRSHPIISVSWNPGIKAWDIAANPHEIANLFDEKFIKNYIVRLIGQFLIECKSLADKGVSGRGLKEHLDDFKKSLEKHFPAGDSRFTRFRFLEMTNDGNMVSLPYAVEGSLSAGKMNVSIDKDSGRVAVEDVRPDEAKAAEPAKDRPHVSSRIESNVFFQLLKFLGKEQLFLKRLDALKRATIKGQPMQEYLTDLLAKKGYVIRNASSIGSYLRFPTFDDVDMDIIVAGKQENVKLDQHIELVLPGGRKVTCEVHIIGEVDARNGGGWYERFVHRKGVTIFGDEISDWPADHEVLRKVVAANFMHAATLTGRKKYHRLIGAHLSAYVLDGKAEHFEAAKRLWLRLENGTIKDTRTTLPDMKPGHTKYRICVTCEANLMRSPFLQFMIQDYLEKRGWKDYFEVVSAGTLAVIGKERVPEMRWSPAGELIKVMRWGVKPPFIPPNKYDATVLFQNIFSMVVGDLRNTPYLSPSMIKFYMRSGLRTLFDPGEADKADVVLHTAQGTTGDREVLVTEFLPPENAFFGKYVPDQFENGRRYDFKSLYELYTEMLDAGLGKALEQKFKEIKAAEEKDNETPAIPAEHTDTVQEEVSDNTALRHTPQQSTIFTIAFFLFTAAGSYFRSVYGHSDWIVGKILADSVIDIPLPIMVALFFHAFKIYLSARKAALISLAISEVSEVGLPILYKTSLVPEFITGIGGGTFSWSDVASYVIGALIVYFVYRFIPDEKLTEARNVQAPEKVLTSASKKEFEQAISDAGGKWYRGIQMFLKRHVPGPITLYYPGSGTDFDHALSATDADVFIFVDKDINAMPRNIVDEITRNNGVIRDMSTKGRETVIRFSLWGKERTLYYYTNTDANDDRNLPRIVKDGYDVYLEKKYGTGYGVYQSWRTLNVGIKYLRPNGFIFTDNKPSWGRGHSIEQERLHTLGTRLPWYRGVGYDKGFFSYFGQYQNPGVAVRTCALAETIGAWLRGKFPRWPEVSAKTYERNIRRFAAVWEMARPFYRPIKFVNKDHGPQTKPEWRQRWAGMGIIYACGTMFLYAAPYLAARLWEPALASFGLYWWQYGLTFFIGTVAGHWFYNTDIAPLLGWVPLAGNKSNGIEAEFAKAESTIQEYFKGTGVSWYQRYVEFDSDHLDPFFSKIAELEGGTAIFGGSDLVHLMLWQRRVIVSDTAEVNLLPPKGETGIERWQALDNVEIPAFGTRPQMVISLDVNPETSFNFETYARNAKTGRLIDGNPLINVPVKHTAVAVIVSTKNTAGKRINRARYYFRTEQDYINYMTDARILTLPDVSDEWGISDPEATKTFAMSTVQYCVTILARSLRNGWRFDEASLRKIRQLVSAFNKEEKDSICNIVRQRLAFADEEDQEDLPKVLMLFGFDVPGVVLNVIPDEKSVAEAAAFSQAEKRLWHHTEEAGLDWYRDYIELDNSKVDPFFWTVAELEGGIITVSGSDMVQLLLGKTKAIVPINGENGGAPHPTEGHTEVNMLRPLSAAVIDDWHEWTADIPAWGSRKVPMKVEIGTNPETMVNIKTYIQNAYESSLVRDMPRINVPLKHMCMPVIVSTRNASGNIVRKVRLYFRTRQDLEDYNNKVLTLPDASEEWGLEGFEGPRELILYCLHYCGIIYARGRGDGWHFDEKTLKKIKQLVSMLSDKEKAMVVKGIRDNLKYSEEEAMLQAPDVLHEFELEGHGEQKRALAATRTREHAEAIGAGLRAKFPWWPEISATTYERNIRRFAAVWEMFRPFYRPIKFVNKDHGPQTKPEWRQRWAGMGIIYTCGTMFLFAVPYLASWLWEPALVSFGLYWWQYGLTFFIGTVAGHWFYNIDIAPWLGWTPLTTEDRSENPVDYTRLIDLWIKNPLFDGLENAAGEDIRNNLRIIFDAHFPGRDEIVKRVGEMPEDEVLKSAEEAINNSVTHRKQRPAHLWLTLPKFIHATTIGVSDEYGPIDLVQFFGDAMMLQYIRDTDQREAIFTQVCLVLRACYLMRDRKKHETPAVGDASQPGPRRTEVEEGQSEPQEAAGISDLRAATDFLYAVKERYSPVYVDFDDANFFVPFLTYRMRHVQGIRFYDLEDYVHALLEIDDPRYAALGRERDYVMQTMHTSLGIITGGLPRRLLVESRATTKDHIKALIEEKTRLGDKRIVIKDLGTGRGEPKEIDNVLMDIARALKDSCEWEIVIQGFDIEPANLFEVEFNMASTRSWYHRLAELFKRVTVDLRYCDLRDEEQYAYIFEEPSDITCYRRIKGAENLPLEKPALERAILDNLSPAGFLIFNNYIHEVVVGKGQTIAGVLAQGHDGGVSKSGKVSLCDKMKVRETGIVADLWDTVVLAAEKAKENGQKIILALDDSWVPKTGESGAINMQMLTMLHDLPDKLRRRGVNNVVFVRGHGEEVIGKIIDEQPAGTPFSNIIVLGDRAITENNVLNRFMGLRGETAGDQAFLIGIDPENLSDTTGRQILEMYLLALRLRDGTEPASLDQTFIRIDKDTGGRAHVFLFTPVKAYNLDEFRDSIKLYRDEIGTKA
ncbi:MAG: hypothetical protein PHS37_05120 [Candidatus Omnitrophica bacterium]|nr:hypothetical protein [Candidatus Omnitrophota bacterium]